MEKIGILIDSTSLTRPDILTHPFVKVVNLKVVLDGTEYEERELPKEVMLEKLHSTRRMATSQPAPGTFLEAFEAFHREGYTHVLTVVLSSAISGTYQSATIAKSMIDFPLEVEIRSPKVASFGVALGISLLCEAVEKKISFKSLLEKYETTYKDATLMFTLSNLMNLFKGGRLGIVSALLGIVLRIKPIIEMINGKLELAKRERTNLHCYEHFMGKIHAFAETHKTVYIDVITINRADWAQKMVDAIHETVPHAIVRVTDYLSPVFYVHLGDQGFGFAILGE